MSFHRVSSVTLEGLQDCPNVWVHYTLWDTLRGLRHQTYFYYNLSVGQFQVFSGDDKNATDVVSIPYADLAWDRLDPAFAKLSYFLDWMDQQLHSTGEPDLNAVLVAKQFIAYGKAASNLSNRIIFFVMAFEALLGNRSEITRALSYRIAQLVAETQNDAIRIAQRCRQYYDVRSNIVHGLYSDDRTIAECQDTLFSGDDLESVTLSVSNELFEWVVKVIYKALMQSRGSTRLRDWADAQAFAGKP